MAPALPLPAVAAVPVVPDWATPDVIERLTRDVLATEMARLRPGGWAWPQADAITTRDWHFVHDLGADSLELLQLTTALADTLQIQALVQAQALYEDPRWSVWRSQAQAQWATPPARMRFQTSGSTGLPRACWHRTDGLWQEMWAMAQVLGPVKRVVSAVRSHHIYGFLFTVLLPHALADAASEQPGPCPVLDLSGQPPIGLAERLQPGDLVIGFPEWWRAALRATPQWPEGVVGVSSTAPCPPDLADALLQAGLQRLLHVYGSTETAGVGWRDWPAHRDAGAPPPPYTLFPHWQGVPGQAEQLQRQLPDGSMLTVPLQDHIDWQDARRFLPGPRQDGAVQVGGVNVQLALIEQRLAQQPGVQAISLRLGDFGGQPRVKAYVVPTANAPAQMAEHLLAWARQHLAPPARPVHITLGPELPRNAMGKLCDWPVPQAPSL